MRKQANFWKTTGAAALLWALLALGMVQPVAAESAKIQDGDTVRVTRSQAMTYPTDTKTNVPHPDHHPLPRGAVDTVDGKRITYTKSDGTVLYFYKLASGVRISADDIEVISEEAPSGNVIREMTVRTDEDYTYVTLDTEQKVTYKVKYSQDSITFTFSNTSKGPSGEDYRLDGIFSDAKWSKGKLTLEFAKSNNFWGYKGYYAKSGKLVLRFQNPPRSFSDLRVAIDAGHGGSDKGALGFDSNYNEKDINLILARQLAEELESRGASVMVIDGAGKSGHWRRENAEKWEANLCLSIHCNSAQNKNATGSEVYYFNPFSYTLARDVSAQVSDAMNTLNRGRKYGIFHITLSTQMRGLLIETGFMSNSGEYAKLVDEDYQKAVVNAIADAIEP